MRFVFDIKYILTHFHQVHVFLFMNMYASTNIFSCNALFLHTDCSVSISSLQHLTCLTALVSEGVFL